MRVSDRGVRETLLFSCQLREQRLRVVGGLLVQEHRLQGRVLEKRLLVDGPDVVGQVPEAPADEAVLGALELAVEYFLLAPLQSLLLSAHQLVFE